MSKVSTGLLILDCVYEQFSAFVVWRKRNEAHFLAVRAEKEEKKAAKKAEKAAEANAPNLTDDE